jgi:hypothetical protein
MEGGKQACYDNEVALQTEANRKMEEENARTSAFLWLWRVAKTTLGMLLGTSGYVCKNMPKIV